MNKNRTLIFTAPYGNGHLQPARVLADELIARGSEVEIYDIISESNPMISKITQNIYKQMYRGGLRRIYQFSYWASDNQLVGDVISYLLRYANKKSLFEKIKTFAPTNIVCVFPAWALYQLLEDYDVMIPVYTIVTDFYMHKLWYHPQVRNYFVANEWTYEFANFLVQRDKFIATGIPIKKEYEEKFTQLQNSETIKKHVLLVAGANGVNTQYLKLAEMLYHHYDDFTVTLICGKNKSLYKQAAYKATNLDKKRFIVHGFVTDMISEYVKADIVVTKSGGNTVSELAALAMPAIFFSPLFGQEMANADFFEFHGVARLAMSIEEAFEILKVLYENTDEILAMKKGYSKFFKPNAAKNIVDFIEQHQHEDHYFLEDIDKKIGEKN